MGLTVSSRADSHELARIARGITGPMPANDISVIAVLGSGTMGHGIAQVCAAAGYPTRMFDLEPSQVDLALEKINKNLEKGVAKGKVSPAARASTLENLIGTSSFAEAISGGDMVIEAVPEKIELKQRLFSDAEKLAPKAIFATNTSSLSIDRIASGVDASDRVIGTHFFNPVHIMKLLEIVTGDRTSEDTLMQVQAFGTRIGKECITVRDSPGFATSRLGLVIGLEAIRMVQEKVASPEDIDKAMTLGYAFPMGPLRLTDLVGLDVRLHIAEYLAQHLPMGGHFQPPQLLRDMVAEGKLGKKSGQGFYRW